MKLNRKTAVFALGLTGVMLFALVLVSLLAFRHFSILSAKAHAETAAEIVRVNLTEMMINGVIDRREGFLSRLSGVNGLRSAVVIRGPDVIRQFGAGLKREQEHRHDAIEQQVLETGKPYFAVIEEGMEPVFRSTIPFTAENAGSPNCMQCHDVQPGAVLGAVTLTLSIPDLKESALATVGGIGLTVAVFAGFALLFMRRMARPLVTTAAEIQEAVENAVQGDFTLKVRTQTDDEIGQIARDFNQLTAFLQRGLGSIRDNVAQLIQCPAGARNENMVTSTADMVQGLVEVAHFKQSVEEDETKYEVYTRLSRVMKDEFGLSHFTIYEVANSKNRMIPMVVDGEFNSSCTWCDQTITIRSEACRVRRTGHVINSIETPHICNQFRRGDDPALEHICLPVIQSGAVGSVVQLVFRRERGPQYQEQLPFISVYLREAAPVLEAKRLMDTLRESTLRDAMTGLHNRRFLEEYMDTLVAGANRRQSQISILMLDLDYFKKVNDTYGHDAGDTVLKTLAKVLTKSVRSSDLVIRYGGEEFMIILVDTAPGAGDAVAEKIREAVEKTKIQLPGAVLEKTISIGVADFPSDSDTFWQAIKFADVALYRAKEDGRNRVVHFTTSMWAGDGDNY